MVSSIYSQFSPKINLDSPENAHGQGQNISTTTKAIKDSISISNTNGKPVGFGEGCSLIAQGFASKLKNMAKSIIQHPIKTIGAMLLGSAALMALPFIGISMATGGAAIVTVYGISAIYKTAKNLLHARKNSKNGDYDAMREDLKNVGGNCVDLALTLPFMPKAFKQLKLNLPSIFHNQVAVVKNAQGKVVADIRRYMGGLKATKYDSNGNVVMQVKNSLFEKIKAAKTWKERFKLLVSQDRVEARFEKMNEAYKKVAIERGFKAPHDIAYTYSPIETSGIAVYPKSKTFAVNIRDGASMTNGFQGGMLKDQIWINRNMPCIYPNVTEQLAKTLGHEFRHVEQKVMMANAEGLKGQLKGKEWAEHIKLHSDKPIKVGTPEHALAEKFYDATVNYVKAEVDYNKYFNNALEVDARTVGGQQIASQILDKYKDAVGINTATQKLNAVKYNPTKDILTTDGIELSELS